MPKVKTVEIGGIRDLLPSWRISLLARNLSPNTLDTYTSAVTMLADHLTERGMPTAVANIKREHVESFLAWMTESYKPASVRNRYTGVRQFFAWCLVEGEITETPVRNIPPPAIPENPPPVLSAAQIKALFKVCSGPTFEDRRDTAIVAVLLDAGLRLGELVGMTLDDIDLETRTITVLGKGRRPRTVGLGVKSLQAVDRYLRARRSHDDSRLDVVWLGLRGPMTGSGVRQMFERRGAQAKIDGLHPHQLRHTFAHSWLAGGGEEGDLMRAGRVAIPADGGPVRGVSGSGTSDRRTSASQSLGSIVSVTTTPADPVAAYVVCGRHNLRIGTVQVPLEGSAYFTSNYRLKGWRNDPSRSPLRIVRTGWPLDTVPTKTLPTPCSRGNHSPSASVEDLLRAVATFRAKGAPETIVV